MVSEENYSLTDITILNEIQAYSTVYDQTGTFNQLLINKTKPNSIDETTTVTDQTPFNWDRSTNSSKQQPKSKHILIEYDRINVKIKKDIRQRKKIKSIDPNEYIRQYGSTLYSPEAFRKIFKELLS